MATSAAAVVELLGDLGAAPGSLIALALEPEVGLGLASAGTEGIVTCDADRVDPFEVVRLIEQRLQPRWIVWSGATTAVLVGGGNSDAFADGADGGVRIARCWDLAAVHRLLFGGWRADPALVWARIHDLPVATIPVDRPPDLFSSGSFNLGSQGDGDDVADGDPLAAIRGSGHLDPTWVLGGWAATPAALGRWASMAAIVAQRQQQLLGELDADGVVAVPGSPSHERSASASAPVLVPVPRALATARSESAIELLCAEMSADGLPVDREAMEALLAGCIGPRPRSDADEAEQRRRRDETVLCHAPPGPPLDLRSPAQVKSLLGRIGLDVADTRAWRLEAHRGAHPLVDALLRWRKAERVATTYGYRWLDAHLGADGRFRGAWTGCDGAAGRMTASAGLHNMPADMRGGVVAERDHVFVRADLGQIEPRVLAAVSGDRALAGATAADDMYAPVAEALGVDRATAKVAVLGAMYGQTTGHGAQALRSLDAAYPVAMAFLSDADRAARAGRDLRTYGGRLVSMSSTAANLDGLDDRARRTREAARGRYGRNAMIQGAAAELFKVWAVTVRARAASRNCSARIVLCLHDELLVHVPAEHGAAVARLLDDALVEAARRWAPDDSVRFVAEISVVRSWADAKA